MSVKILLIEDSADYRDVVAFYLQKSGFDVVVAADGREGLQQARAPGIHLIITDVMLPSLNGYEICSLLKQDGRYQRIPIIVLTASKLQATDRELALQCGADAFCPKSIELKQLVEKIRALLAPART
jgi:DNA-binding response OmpR family regulator